MTAPVQSKTKDSSPRNAARDALILEHVPLVKFHAYRLAVQLPSSIEMDDLINAGILGLMDAVAKFDASRGVKFKTYADVRIRGAMIDSLRQLDWAPQTLRKKGRDLKEAQERLTRNLGREATDQEVCQELRIELQQLHALTDQLNSLNIRGDHESRETDNERLIDHYPDSPSKGPDLQLQTQELKKLLAEIVDQLNEKERLIVSLYYFEELTMKEIGAILEVNESRVSQIHAKVIAQLRQKVSKAGYQLSKHKANATI